MTFFSFKNTIKHLYTQDNYVGISSRKSRCFI